MDDRQFKVLLDLSESVGGLHVKTDQLKSTLEEHKKEDDIAHMRITSLEQTRSQAKGGYAVLVVGVSVATVLLTLLASTWAGK